MAKYEGEELKELQNAANFSEAAYNIGEDPTGYKEYFPPYSNGETGLQVSFIELKSVNKKELRILVAGTNFYQGNPQRNLQADKKILGVIPRDMGG